MCSVLKLKPILQCVGLFDRMPRILFHRFKNLVLECTSLGWVQEPASKGIPLSSRPHEGQQCTFQSSLTTQLHEVGLTLNFFVEVLLLLTRELFATLIAFKSAVYVL